MEWQEIVLTVSCYAVVIALAFSIFIGFMCSTGEIRIARNPNDDPDNPYILTFNVNPNTWLSKRYVLLRVRKKNK